MVDLFLGRGSDDLRLSVAVHILMVVCGLEMGWEISNYLSIDSGIDGGSDTV